MTSIDSSKPSEPEVATGVKTGPGVASTIGLARKDDDEEDAGGMMVVVGEGVGATMGVIGEGVGSTRAVVGEGDNVAVPVELVLPVAFASIKRATKSYNVSASSGSAKVPLVHPASSIRPSGRTVAASKSSSTMVPICICMIARPKYASNENNIYTMKRRGAWRWLCTSEVLKHRAFLSSISRALRL